MTSAADSAPLARTRCLVVGVTQRQSPVVIQAAARLARDLSAMLICAHVAPGTYVVAEHPDGSVESRPVDPDLPDWNQAEFDPELANLIAAEVRPYGVAVDFRELAGDIAHALGRLADILGADLIVVGTRHGGLRSSLREFFGGSIAAHLAHRQPRPVLVIPLNPVAEGAELPWDETER